VKKKSNFWKTLLTLMAAAAGLMLVRLLLLGLLVSGLFLALFSACSEHPSPHSRREVLAYLREEYPGEEFTVEKRWTPHVTREGYEDGGRVWNCYYEDLPEVLFQAVSFRRNGGPIPIFGYDLTDNYPRTFQDHYIKQYQQTAGSLEGWEWAYQLKIEFSSMAEARPAAERIQTFCDWFKAQPHAPPLPSLRCQLGNMVLPVRVLEDHYLFIDTDSGGNLGDSVLTECSRLLKDFYTFYNLPSPDFTAEELAEYTNTRWTDTQGTMFDLDGNRVPASVLDGIGLMPYAGSDLPWLCISYGGLYELLFRLGLEPEGVPEYFAVTGADGHFYEFSYASVNAEGNLCWPVRRDGERLECLHSGYINCAPALQLKDEIFQAVTGLTVLKEP